MNLLSKMRIKIKYRLGLISFEKKLSRKWKKDCENLPLSPAQFELYKNIHHICLRKLGEFPDLINCRDFNDRIQWLKLFDQRPEIIEYSDKILIKDYIESRVGKKYVAETFQIHEKYQQIDFEKLPNAFVVKANHDTGSVILVKNKTSFDFKKAERKITKALNRVYGWTKGEWAYSYIVPKVLVEEYIGIVADSPPPDYKFHCVNGKVRFCQYIYDRGVDTKEVITDKRGIPFNFVLFEDFKQGSGFNIPEKWREMIKVAEILSEDFKYVRVDMYCVDNRLIVGEMTFHPKFGCYVGDGQKKLGKLLDFDRDTYIPCQYIKPGPL